MFWGDRYGKLKDPFGHSWAVATHKEDVAPADMPKRMEEAMAKIARTTDPLRLSVTRRILAVELPGLPYAGKQKM